jgi:ComF family protein
MAQDPDSASRAETEPTPGRTAGGDLSPCGIPFQRIFLRIARSLADAFLPVRCAACRSFFRTNRDDPDVSRSTENGAGALSGAERILSSVVCGQCLNDFVPVASPLCTVCGVPFKSREGADHMCGECLREPRHFRRARAAAVYSPVMMALVRAFKYNGKIRLAQPLGVLLASTYRRFWPEADVDLVLPVPLHRRRFRHRGFNQAYLLVKDWDGTDSPLAGLSPAVVIAKEVILRIRPTTPQTGLGRQDRLKNIKKAFRVDQTPVIEGRRILLVDDVYTTGATVDECAKTLLKSGAARVDVLTLARAV